MTPDERIARLQHIIKQLLDEVRNLPDEALYRDPPDGEWSIMRNLAHVAEMLPYWAHQAEAIARVPGERFGRTHDDPERIGAIEEHSNDVLEEVIARIQASADECIDVLRRLPPQAWSKSGLHPSRGEMSVEQMVDAFVVGHVAAHRQQVEAALAAVEANPSG